MKRLLLILTVLATFMLSACSFLDEVNQSIDYVQEAQSYVTTLSDFTEEAPAFIQEITNNAEAREDLEEQLQTLSKEIEAFNEIDAPAFAEEIHQNIISKNEVLLDEVNTMLENGEIAIKDFENSELMTTINDLSSLLESVESLNQ